MRQSSITGAAGALSATAELAPAAFPATAVDGGSAAAAVAAAATLEGKGEVKVAAAAAAAAFSPVPRKPN